jgi:hypothetical protein
MAANETVYEGVAGPSFSWWMPRPSSTICALLVGAALAVMLTIDQSLGKSPARSYGWPFTYQVEPRGAMGAVPASRFDPGRLAVDVVISAGILASAYCTMQWLAHWLIGPSRYTVRSSLLTIAAIAVLLSLYRLSWQLALLILYEAFLYGLISPLLLIAILVHRGFSSGRSPTR